MTSQDNIVSFKTIESLNTYNFHIPSYQRGYRWTKQQVEDLLNDINSFQHPYSWYCLQPIIVKQCDKQTCYEVIDGQQRLTTIYLILKCLERNQPFQLSYEHKDLKDVFEKLHLHPNLDKPFDDDIDAYFIRNAYLTIKEWLDTNNKNNKNTKFEDNLLKNTKVIWYEIRDTDDPREIFTRINSGKIGLTDAELIKALFLKQSNFQQNTQPSQLTIASQWDTIQHKLHDDRFWYFLTNDDKNQDDSRMALMLELALSETKSKTNNHNFDLFYRYYKNADPIKQWQAIQNTFDTLTEWYDDTKLYHQVGYLLAISGTEQLKLSTLLAKYKKCTSKSKFNDYLVSEIRNSLNLKAQDLDSLEYHVDDTKIRKVLLLHNLMILAQSGDPTIRFAFDRYKKERWDIEHIHAIADVGERSIKQSDRKRWYDDNKLFAPAEHADKFKAFCDELGLQFDGQLLDLTTEQFAELKDEQFAKLMSLVLGETDNQLKNLCLLDQGTNRSYKNDSFGAKRRKLIERETGNDQLADGDNRQFILHATRNIFMKYYSKTATNLSQWESQDRADYLNEIKQRIELYLENQNG